MQTLGATILAIFATLRAAIGQVQTADRAHNARLFLVWARWGRTANRLVLLFERWVAGTLPKNRPSQAGVVRKARPKREPGAPVYPRGRGWLANGKWQVNAAAALLNHHLHTPAFQTFLREVPQAGRLLRPVLHLLSRDPPAVIALPARPRRVRRKVVRARPPPRRAAAQDRAGVPKLVIDTS